MKIFNASLVVLSVIFSELKKKPSDVFIYIYIFTQNISHSEYKRLRSPYSSLNNTVVNEWLTISLTTIKL